MSKKEDRFEGLIAIVGNPGKGKTYFLQKKALEYKKRGYLVVLGHCGWSIEGAIHFETREELLGVHLDPALTTKRIAVFVDELNDLFPARDWSKTEKKFRDYFALYRHGGVGVFYYTTQSIDDVEKVVRSKTEFVWQCGFLRPLRLFYHILWSKADFEKMEQNIPGKYRSYGRSNFFAKNLGSGYNAYARYDIVSKLHEQLEGIQDFVQKESVKLSWLQEMRARRA